jgi:hypothetical protein
MLTYGSITQPSPMGAADGLVLEDVDIYGSITQPSPMGAADGIVLEDIDIGSCFLQPEKRPYYGRKNDYIKNNNWGDFSKPIIYPDVSHQLKTSIDLRSPQEHLANIIKSFHISVIKLSTVFSVPWKLVYAWIDGDSLPNDEQLRLIMQFSHAADLFQAKGVVHTDSVLEIRMFDDRSMLDLIAEGTLTEDKMETLVKRAALLDEEYENLKIYQSTSQPHDEWRTTIVVPIMTETN